MKEPTPKATYRSKFRKKYGFTLEEMGAMLGGVSTTKITRWIKDGEIEGRLREAALQDPSLAKLCVRLAERTEK